MKIGPNHISTASNHYAKPEQSVHMLLEPKEMQNDSFSGWVNVALDLDKAIELRDGLTKTIEEVQARIEAAKPKSSDIVAALKLGSVFHYEKTPDGKRIVVPGGYIIGSDHALHLYPLSAIDDMWGTIVVDYEA